MRILTIIALLVVFSSGQAKSPDETKILGDWCAGSKSSYHEYFELAIEDGDHQFYSWLHDRPAISGRWKLINKTLTITGSSGDKFIYIVDKATSRKLLLHEKRKALENYVRENCFQFEQPPTE